MKIYYDEKVDETYREFLKKRPDGVTEISDFLNLDTTKEVEIVGMVLVNASKKIGIKTLFNYE